jgi:hypothetical protein
VSTNSPSPSENETPVQHLTVLASGDLHAAALAARVDTLTTIAFEDREDLATRLLELARALPARPRTLDLVGLTGLDKLLTFHGRLLDVRTRRVRAYFRELAEMEVPARLGVTTLRLVGCTTATGEHARRTLDTLAEILGIEVTGTTELVSASDLSPTGFVHPPPRRWTASGRSLDLDGLAPRVTDANARVLDQARGRDLLRLIRRDAGVELPTLLALPHATLAIPSSVGGLFHHVEVLLDHELVRAGQTVYGVEDARALRLLVDAGR